MTLEDLQYIFDHQIEEGTEKLYFMLVDGDRSVWPMCNESCVHNDQHQDH